MRRTTSRCIQCLVVVLSLVAPAVLTAAPPDLTAPGVIATIDRTYTYNLGSTGLRGWIYVGGGNGADGTITVESRQILVTVASAPANAVLAVDDVILGAMAASSGDVPPFTSVSNDCRKAFGAAIGDAEKTGAGTLRVKRWRAGVTTDENIPMAIMGDYTATAPYSCPKSALILANARTKLVGQLLADPNFLTANWAGAISGLALLAGVAPGDPNYATVQTRLQTYARALATAGPKDNGLPIWDWGYLGLFLAEYYLSTSDANVLAGLGNYAVALAQAQSINGTYGHSPSVLRPDGSGRRMGIGYGPVNQVGIIANMALVMGKKALVAGGQVIDPEIDPAIQRGSDFFAWFANKGPISYGEHEPFIDGYSSNGKDPACAVLFGVQTGRTAETEAFARMATSSFNGREYGHTGQGFSYLWGAMGANMGGALALAEHLKPVRWHLDLSRRTDGSFAYDGQEQYGPGTTDNGTYLGASGYYGMSATASYVLTYSLPLQRLYITGRNANPANTLDASKVAAAIAAATFKVDCPGFTTTQLIAFLSDYDPVVRNYAAIELGKRTPTSGELTTLRTMLSGTDANGRMGACQALGLLKDATALPLIVQRLDKTVESNLWVRAKAASAIRSYTPATASAHRDAMLTAFVANATDPDVIVWSDPIQIANNYLSSALFGDAIYGGGNIRDYTINASKSLLYPAVQTGLKQPDSYSRTGAARFCYDKLPLVDVQALIPDFFKVIEIECLADRMWGASPRADGIKTMAKYKIRDGISLARAMLNIPAGFEWGSDETKTAGLNALAAYGDAARWTLPTLRGYLSTWSPSSSSYPVLVSAIASIENAITAPAQNLGLAVANSQVVVTTNAIDIILTGTSPRLPSVTFTNVTAPAHGTLSGTAPNLTYTPTGGYTGPDHFTFQVEDGLTTSEPGTASIIVGAAGTGLKGEYFDNKDFTNLKLTRTDAQVNFDWGAGSPDASIGADTFSVRWSGLLLVPETGTYMFSTLNSDGARLYLNGVAVLDDFIDQTTNWKDGTSVDLTAGEMVDLTVEYYENTGSAVAKLKWTGPSFAGSNGTIIARQWLFDGTGMTRTPYAFAQTLTTLQNTAQAITLTGSGGSLTYSVVTPPAHGALSGTAPSLTYTPAVDYSGWDSFTFRVNNGTGDSAPATVSIGILAGQPVSFTWLNPASGNWSVAGNWTPAAPAATGQPYYTLNFTPSGTYTATHDLNNGFQFNQLNVAGGVTIGGTSSLALTANGYLLPQFSQNSSSAATVDTPVTLAATTTFGGTGGGAVTITNVISGAGGLIKNSAGMLKLHGLRPNTYSGGTFVNVGTLHLGTMVGGVSPLCTNPVGTGTVTLNGGTIELERVTASNALTMNGGTLLSNNGWGATWSGPVSLNADSTVDTPWNLTLNAAIGGAGGITKTGDRILYLSGANSYTGPNRVTAGTLSCSQSAALGTGPLDISSGAKVALNFTGTRHITSLTLGGELQPDGTYGSSASPATTKNDTYFSGTGAVMIGLASQTITFDPLSAKTYGDAPFALTATASSGLTVSYASSDPTVASVAGSSVTILKAGTAMITANQTGNGLYLPAPPVAQTLTVNKALQTITFSPLPAVVYGDAPFALTATTSSGLVVSYSSSDPTVASVSGSSVTILKVGSVTMTATQTGDVNFNATSPVQQALTVTPLPVALAGTRPYDGTTALALTDLSIANKVGGDDLSLSGNATLSNKNAGVQLILGNAAYVPPIRVQSATGNTGANAATTIAVTLGATPANGNTLVAVVSTRGTSSDRVTGISGGGVTWSRASQAANANGTTTEIWYGPNVSGGTTSITVTQASLRSAVVVTEYSGILSASPLDQVANATGGSTSAATGTTPSTTQANELWVGGIGLSGSAYTLGAALNGFAAVTNVQTGSATASDNAKVYLLESITNATGTAASGGAVSGTQSAVIAQRGPVTTATTATTSLGLVVPSGVQVGDLLLANIANYQGTAASISAPGTWTTTSAAGTLTVGTRRGALFYRVATSADTSAPTYTFTVAAGGTTPGAAGAIVAFSGVDTASPFDVAPGALSTGTGGTAASATAITTLSANAAVVMFGMQARTTSGNQTRTWSLQNTGAPGSLTLTELYDAAQTSTGYRPGVMAAWATMAVAGGTGTGAATLDNTGNHYGLVLCALKPATLPVQWSGAIATFKAASVPSLALGGSAAANYTLTGLTGSVTVTPKALTVAGATVLDKVYDGTPNATLGSGALLAAEAPGAGTTVDGQPYSGDEVGLASSGLFASKDVGSGIAVSLVASLTGAQAGNYTLTQPAGLTGTITPKALTLTGATVAGKVYDGTTNATFSAGALLAAEAAGAGSTADGKPYTGDAVTLTRSGAFNTKDAGTGKAATSSSTLSGAQAGNYTLTQPTGLTGDIASAPLTVTADHQNKNYGETLTFGPGATQFITSGGLVDGETIGSVTLSCTGGDATAAVGTYPITPSAATGGTFLAGNYTITYADGTLTVLDADPPTPDPMTFAVAPAPLGNNAIVMTATTATDAFSPPVSYSFENTTNSSGSGWTSATVWTNTGLDVAVTYGYRVKARDAVGNETTWSAVATGRIPLPPPTVGFAPVSASGAESATNVTVTVVLSHAHEVPVTVEHRLATPSGTATPGRDFVYVPGTLTFNAGETNKSFAFTVVDDAEAEEAETIAFEFGTLGNGVAGANNTFAYTVQLDTADWYTVPFRDTFEDRTLGNLNDQFGWLAQDADVQGGTTFGGSAKAAAVTGDGGFMKHLFTDGQTRIWTDMRIQVVYSPEKPTPDPDSTTALYFRDDGQVMAFNGTNAVATGQSVASGSWVRMTIFSDYTEKSWRLYVDGRPSGQYGFYYTTANSFTEYHVKGGSTVVDNVAITLDPPAMAATCSLIVVR